jgi:hypothetical protein
MFLRKPKLPPDLRPALAGEERVVAWASTSDGGAVIVTNLGLWLPGHEERLGWHEIHKAAWEMPLLTITPAEHVGDGDGYTLMADAPVVSVVLESPGDVPHQIRTRVTRSVVFTEHYTVPNGGLRVVGRKVPGVDGLTWYVRADPGTEIGEPAAERAIAQLIADLAADALLR